jgi:hypothetical protein
MGKAWQKIKGFFRGGRSAKPPKRSELYSGPAANWGATIGADGTVQGGGGFVPLAGQARGSQTGTQAAMRALANTERIANTGWTAQDRQAFGAADRASQRSAQAAIGALAQQSRARGVENSGAQFAAAAGTAQSAANAAADRGAQIAQMGAERRGQASQALAGMGMGIDAQTFGQNMGRASAVDQFNRMSTGMTDQATQQAYENRRQYEADEEARRQRVMDRLGQVYEMGSSAAGMFGGGS